jgi:hypothetical protein
VPIPGCVCHSFAAAPRAGEGRHRREVLLARTGDLRVRRAGALRQRLLGEVDQGLGDHAGGAAPGARLRHVAHVALAAPPHQLLDELVELRGAQDPDRDRPADQCLLVAQLGEVVAAPGGVDAGDRRGDVRSMSAFRPAASRFRADTVRNAIASASSGPGGTVHGPGPATNGDATLLS